MQLQHGELYGMNKLNHKKIRSSFYKTSKISKILKKNAFFKENSFSIWERKILKKMRNSELDIETKFRNFPLHIEKEKFEYIPDFLIKGFLYKQREVIVEAHEEISEEDVNRYRKFRSVFGVMYYLILIVKDKELQKWNDLDQGVQGIFNEIWSVNNVDLLIKYLLNKRRVYSQKMKLVPQTAICPAPPNGHGCGKKADDYDEVVRLFGYRGKIVQSLCRQCRSKHAQLQRKKTRR